MDVETKSLLDEIVASAFHEQGGHLPLAVFPKPPGKAAVPQATPSLIPK